MKFRRLFKKAAVALMAAVTALSVLPATTAFAAGDIGTISFTHTYDSSGNTMRYNSSAVFDGYTAGGTGKYKYRMFVDGENAFCIQPGVPLKTGNTLKKASSDTWNALSTNQKKAVGLALLYGYQGNRSHLSGSDDEKWLATQTLVWEFVTGCREATGSYQQNSTKAYSLHFGSNYPNSGAKAAYDQIVSLLSEHNTIPSFMSGGKNDITKELAYKDGKYSITLTDKNSVLSDYSFSSSDGNVKVSRSGDKLTISSAVAVSGSVRITAKRNGVPTVSDSAKMIAYGDPNLQDLVTGVENADTVVAYLNIETPTGTIALKKTSEDGVVGGIQFNIKGDNFNKTVTTDKDGNITVEGLFPATYTIGLLPDSMAKSKLHGVEIDSLTGRIAKQLYQKANIAIEGFEKTKLPDDHFDVVLGNVPFGDFKVNDSRYNAQKFLIHDFFFAKALDKVRAGGVVMFITSKGTMDKASPEVRKYIAQRAELLGAIRLPDNTFRANAGTEVTSDILILQKRDRVIDIESDWVHLDTDENGVTMNSYFVEHPEMVLGNMVMESTRFGKMDAACKAKKDIPLAELLHEAVQNINGEIPEYEIDEISDEQDEVIPADPSVKNFSYTLVNGKVYFRENDVMTPANLSMTAESRVKGLVEIRDCVRKLIAYQTEDYPEELIRTEQENLNRLYDAYTAKYGLINSRGNYLAFASDESYFLLCSLEVLDDEGNFKRKADMFSKRTIKPHRAVTSVETASEALAISIGEKACVDLPFMAKLTGKEQAELIRDLQGVIFKIPQSEPAKYVTADEYLSGNVRNKLVIAETAAKTDPELIINAEALKKVIPKDLSAGEISVRLGATWIPQEDIQRFVIELLTPSSYAAGRIRVRYTAINGDWFIENKSSDYGNVKADSTYGTKRASAYRIIEDTLNLRDVRIFDYVLDEHGNRKAVFNHKETTAAQAKQEVIKQAFQDWIWKDPERRNRLVRSYNDTFNSVRPREYDGSHITFGGISPEITLRPHQVNAIAHILYGGNTLLAHKVGAGKTFEMVAAAQESKRLGLCQKSMFVVPNHLVCQWASEYLRLYPSANILVARKQDFETANRKKFCGRIATGDYDAVIIGHSQFEKIPMSLERQYNMLQEQLDDIERGIDDIQKSHGEQFTVKQLMKTRKSIQAKLDRLNDTKRKDSVIDFEELGVDRLFIDESHFYKNLYLYTKMRNVGGIAQTEAQKSSDLFMKCRYLDEITGNRGTIFATGTPVSNSMVELYSVQRYLQYDTLMQNGLQHFDSWASTFGETVTALELAPEGTNYRAKTRFAKFYNLPELMQMFREVADIQTADMLKLPVPKVNYHNIKTKPSEIQTEMVANLAKRAEKVRARAVEPNIDKKPYALYQAEKQGLPTRDNVARQAVDEAISKSFTLKDFDRLMAEMGYKCSFDPNRKYWTIIGRGWKRPKRLYKLGEDYTNERIMERIRENSYAVKFNRFTEPTKQVKAYRLKGSLSGARKIGGLRGLYLHYCYKLGILPKGRKQNYAKLHYILRDDLMKMDAITKETRLLCRCHIDTAEQLLSYQGSLETEKNELTEQRVLCG